MLLRPDTFNQGRCAVKLHPAWHLAIYLVLCLILTKIAGLALSLCGLRDPFLVLFIALTAATWLAVHWLDREEFTDLGLVWHPSRAVDLAVGLGLPCVLLAAIFCLEWVAGWLMIVEVQPGGLTLLPAAIWRLVLVAWYEELFARGYLLQTLSRFTRPWLANFLAALVFAGLHGANPGATPLALSGILLAGLLLGLCYQVTHSLYLPMAFHLSWNLSQTMLGFPVSGLRLPGLLRLIREGPALYTGGSFGPEAGLLGILAILVAMGVVWEYGKRDRARA